jgi:hypothetical protein
VSNPSYHSDFEQFILHRLIGSTIGPGVASCEAMRSLCLVSSAALLLSSGCVLAIGPAAGAGVGLAVGGIKKAKHEDASIVGDGVVGALIGTAVEAVVVGVALYSLSTQHWEWGDD